MTDKELEKIYNEAYRAVYWTAFSLLKNEDDAQDIVQDTFVSLINSYDSIKDKTKILPWLKKVAANKSLNRLTRTKTDNVEDEFFDTVETVPEDFLPDSLVESAETRKIIMDIINNSLSEDIRRTLILFYFDEMSTKEVAEVLGIPEGTVSWRINSAKKKIKKEVEKYEKDNDTKLYMVVPFLTSLFTKEAEQVAFKPMSASLLSLSASTDAAGKAVGSKIATEAVKKGTEIAMKKTIITIVSVALAGSATAGIVYFATKKDNGSAKKKETEKNAANEITMIDPDDESETKASVLTETSEDTVAATSEESTETETTAVEKSYPEYRDSWAHTTHFYLYGKEIVIGQSTIADVVSTGCTYLFEDENGSFSDYTPDDPYGIMDCIVYKEKDSSEFPRSPDWLNASFVVRVKKPDDNPNCLVKDHIVTGIIILKDGISAWSGDLTFDFPLTLTPEQLIENSGEREFIYEDPSSKTYFYAFPCLDSENINGFRFDGNGQLVEVGIWGA